MKLVTFFNQKKFLNIINFVKKKSTFILNGETGNAVISLRLDNSNSGVATSVLL